MKHRRNLRRLLYLLSGLLFIWIVAVQSGCMAMRTPDGKWAAKLGKKGQNLPPQFLDVPSPSGRSIHTVLVNPADSLPLVVFVHGSPGSADACLDYLADTNLSLRARLAAVDRPGFGYTDFGKPEISLEAQAADVHAVMEHLSPNRRVILVGHSLGGPLIVRVAMDYPERVAGLVIVAGSVDPSLEPHPWWEPVVDAPPVRWLIPKSLWASNHEIRYAEDELKKMLPFWAGIRCPVRILHAQNDRLVPVGNVDFARRMLTGCSDLKVTIYPDGDHFIMWSKEEGVRGAILDLLSPS